MQNLYYSAEDAKADVKAAQAKKPILSRYSKRLLNNFLKVIKARAQIGQSFYQIHVPPYVTTASDEEQFILILQQFDRLGYRITDNGPILNHNLSNQLSLVTEVTIHWD